MDECLGTWTGGGGLVEGGTCHYPVRLSIADGKVDRRFVWPEPSTQEYSGQCFEF